MCNYNTLENQRPDIYARKIMRIEINDIIKVRKNKMH